MSTLLTPAVRALLSLPVPLITRIAGPPPTIDGRTLHPSVHLLLFLQAKGIGAARTLNVAERRRAMESNAALAMPRVRGVVVQDHVLAGGIGAREYRSARLAGPAPVIVYFHGGGWVTGSLDSHDATCRMLALHSRCIVVAVDYRLAPEHPYPAGLDDAQAAFEDIHAHPARFGAVPGAVAVMGDSAGANLSAALCLRTRGGPVAPTAQLLVYPAVDLRLSHASIDTFREGFFLTKEDMLWFRDQYLLDLDLMTEPEVSPLLAPDLTDLPPTAVWTAGFDPLRDEGQAFARALAAAGVTAMEYCLDDQVHGFLGMGVLAGGMDRIEGVGVQAGNFVRQALAATADDTTTR